MSSLPIAIGGFIALVVVVMFKLKLSTRRRVPFPAWKADPVNAYARLVRAGAGTELDILEDSTRTLLGTPDACAMVGTWVRLGAKVRLLVHETSDDDASRVKKASAHAGAGSLTLYALKKSARTSALGKDTRTFHFAVARSPDQLWLEGYHADDDAAAQLCEYVPDAKRDPRWQARADDFDKLLADATEVK